MVSLVVEILSSLGCLCVLGGRDVLFVVEETSPKITDGITLLTCCRLDGLLNLLEILNTFRLDVPTQTHEALGKLGRGTQWKRAITSKYANGQHLLLLKVRGSFLKGLHLCNL